MSSTSSPETLSEFLPFLLFQAAELTSRNFQKRYQSRYGMLRTEWRVLFHLGSESEQTAKQICQRASLHKTKVSRAVKALEAKRFVTRFTVETDRRSERLGLTKAGQRVFEDLSGVAEDFDQTLEQAVGSKEHKQLVKTLQRLIELHQTKT